MTEKWKTEKWR